MALKDHITDSTKLSEEEIEGIIADFIKYDPTNKTIVFLPKTHDFSAEKKVLLYLVALRGWHFLLQENPPAGNASPKEIEQITGVRGGTIRPLLRDLAQAKILTNRKGKYELPTHNLTRVREMMNGKVRSLASSSRANPDKHGKKDKHTLKLTKGKNTKNKPSLSEGFLKLLRDEWFKGGKTLAQLKNKLDEMTIFPPMSHLPSHLLKAYRNGRLTRKKEVRSGKNVWIYFQS